MNDEITINQDELDTPAPSRRQRLSNRVHWKRAFKWLLITVLLVIVAAAAFVYFNVSKISVNPFGFGQLKGEAQGRVNILMLGVGDPGHDGADLSDTDIVLSIDTKTHQVAVISVPRDTQVNIPGYGPAKINNANADGGVPLATQVFQNTLGIPIDYYVKANFTGLEEVVDAVGGIDVDNTTLLDDPEYPCANNQYKSCGYRLTPGHYHLNGAEALEYVRCRKGTCGDDFGRAARQQEVMQQIRLKATSAGTLSNPVTLAKLVSAAGSNVQTNLSLNNLLRLDQLTKSASQGSILSIVFNLNPDGFLETDPANTNLLPVGGNFDAIQQFVQNVFTLGPIWSEHPTAIIENGTTTAGVAAGLNQKIQASNYDVSVTAVTNALTRNYTTSQIIDYTGGKKPHTAAYLESLLKIKATTPPPTPTTTPPADFVIILGADYATANPPSAGTSDTATAGSAAASTSSQ
jgi:LCP family protein required for cell wall assembly